ncbi:MAG: magnesium chelatase [Saprospiraceae bacterium]|nr:magnesium chelatase [Saprospiraceae bacterium]
MKENTKLATTLGELKAIGYAPKQIKAEMRENLVAKLRSHEEIFPGIIGYQETVLPDIERAVLSQHNILLLGLRGQAKTRIARLLTNLLDEYIPIVKGGELNDDPINPITKHAQALIREFGDDTPISWLHRDDRYVEKLATPDVSVADLIGDVDPIKAATLKLPYSDERVIHYGLVPRSHRSIFVINELPDLQARIQVSLFNMLQEGDIQIRGFKLRLPLDIMFVFTANPEDYTNRGSIITPLKDRIESQILTHYPAELSHAKRITNQEANLENQDNVYVPEILRDILERIAINARTSELIDEKSGVSARLSISGLENLVSSAERRMLLNSEKQTTARLSDFWGVIPSITGKVELLYEGEQEGPYQVALTLMGEAIRDEFLKSFPNPDEFLKETDVDIFEDVRNWFSSGHTVEILNDESDEIYEKELAKVPGLATLAKKVTTNKKDALVARELILHALAEFNIITREMIQSKFRFRDTLADMLDDLD